MVKSNDITVTDARFKKALEQGVSHVINQNVPQMIQDAVDQAKIRTGVVTKFYPYLDKAEVQLDNVNQKVLCKLSHRFVGALIDFYVPNGDEDYCEKLKEPCIIPIEPLYCLIIRLHEDDSNEYLLMDYYYPDDIVGFAPPGIGTMRISSFRVSGEDFIEFGSEGLKIQTKTPVESYFGEYDDDVTEHEVYTKDEVYTKEEVYTKSEVDELIAAKIAEALEEYENEED